MNLSKSEQTDQIVEMIKRHCFRRGYITELEEKALNRLKQNQELTAADKEFFRQYKLCNSLD